VSDYLADPMFWVVSAPLAVMAAASLRRIVDPFWADPARRTTTERILALGGYEGEAEVNKNPVPQPNREG
jgi:hypothetical protein